jgi:hypothetical protein
VWLLLLLLIVSSAAVSYCLQPKVYTREGKELGEFPKGDMYIRDLKNTKGECVRVHKLVVLSVISGRRSRLEADDGCLQACSLCLNPDLLLIICSQAT